MNSEEQTLIDGLFTRLKQAESGAAPRDALAFERIKEHVAAQPAVPYYMAQAILVQEAALKRMDEQVKKLQADLAQAQAQAASAAQQPAASGGFLSSLFGGGSQPAPAPAPQSSGGWREPGNNQYANQQPAPQQQYAPPPQQAAPAAPAGGGFMRGALQTAAGVAGGVMLAEGISSLFHHENQPQEIVEVLQEPAPMQDQGGWGEPDRIGNNDSWANNNNGGGFADSDFGNDSGGSFFNDDDDDSFV